MSLKNVTVPEENVAVLEIKIEKDVFDNAVTAAFKKKVGTIVVPGFRRGKAPRSVIEKMYGKGVFYDDAINDLIPEAYEEALAESKLDPVSRPEFDVTSIDEEGVVLTAKIYTRPTATVSSYAGLTAERDFHPATDENVNAELDTVRHRNSRTVDVTDRPAQLGDTAVIDYSGFCKGEQFEGGTAKEHPLKLGSGQFIPGFEDQIVGHSCGDEFDVNVTFPEEYNSEALAGQDACFKTVLHKIQFEELPEADDEFAKDVSEFDTLGEYKADLKAKIDERNTQAADNAVEEQLIDALLANTTVNIPAPMLDGEIDQSIRDYDQRLQMQGMSLDMYMKYTQMTPEDLRHQFSGRAERQLKTRLALQAIVAAENIEAAEDEIEAEYNKLAQTYNMEVDKIRESLSSDIIAEDIKIRHAVELIKAKAVITDKVHTDGDENAVADNKPAPKKKKTSKKADDDTAE